MVVTTNSHCKSVISGTIFYSWDYYNDIVKSTSIILYCIFLVDIAIKKSCLLKGIWNIVKNTIYFSIIVKTPYIFSTLRKIYGIFHYILYFPEGTTILDSCPFTVTNNIYFFQCNVNSRWFFMAGQATKNLLILEISECECRVKNIAWLLIRPPTSEWHLCQGNDPFRCRIVQRILKL